MSDLEHRIRKRAYQIWLDEGRPEGRDKIHWEMAAKLVAKEHNQKSTLREETKKARDRKRSDVRKDYLRYWSKKFGFD